MKKVTCCFSGHRIICKEESVKIQSRLELELMKLVAEGVRYFGSGGAIGFDTISAKTVLKLRFEFPHIRLILVLPCKNQTKNWSAENIKEYNQILNKADKVVYVSENYYSGCMQKRNRYLVDNSGICVCYLKKLFGGTAYTVDYARQNKLKIINLAR